MVPKYLESNHNLALAAGTGAGNRSMRKAGRTAWSLKDLATAAETYEKIMHTGKEPEQ